MKVRRAFVFYPLGLTLAFGMGWMLKPGAEKERTGTRLPGVAARSGAGNGVESGWSREAGMRTTKDGESWAETAARELAEVRAAMKPGEVNAVLIAKLNAVLNIGESSIRVPRWQALISAMRPVDVEAVREIFRLNDKEGRYWPDEFVAFWKQWGFVDGPAAAKVIASTDKHPHQLPILMAGWGRSDPQAALQWVREHPEGIDIREAMKGIVTGAGDGKAADAEALLLANADDPLLKGLQGKVAWMKIYQEGLSGAMPWFTGVAGSSAPESYKQANMQTMVNLMSERTGNDSAAAFAGRFINEPWVPADAGKVLGREWAEKDPAAGMASLAGIVSVDARNAATSTLTGNWAAKDPEGLSVWLTENKSHPLFDQATSALVKAIASSDPEAAKLWKKQIGDPDNP